MKISEMEKSMRPREKADRYGLDACTDLEILCLLLGSGTRNKDVHAIAGELLKESGNLYGLLNMPAQQIRKIEGIGPAKALQLMAAGELVKRALQAGAYQTIVTCPENLAEWMKAEYGTREQEHFIAVYLNTAGGIISHRIISIGTQSQSLVHPREVFRHAYLHNAQSVILAHNHPGGTVKPSLEDIRSTEMLVKAGNLAKIPVLDHIIIGQGSYFSFKAAGLLDEMDPEQRDAA